MKTPYSGTAMKTVALGWAVARAAIILAQIPDAGQGLAILPTFTVATNVASADSDYTRPGRPGLATDGTNYLVLSCQFDTSPVGLFCLRLSRRGEIIGRSQITEEADQFSNPTASFDGTNFLIVFQHQGQIYGLRVAPNGQLLDPTPGFRISAGDATSNWGPKASFDGKEFLVVWDKFSTNYDIYAALIAPTGETAGEFPLFSAAGEQVESTVAFGAGNFFVAWRDTRSGSGPATDTHIFATRVSPQGNILDPLGIAICTAAGGQGEPHAAFDGQNYFVVWSDARLGQSRLDIFGARISPQGALLDGPAETGGIAVNESPTDKGDPRVCFDGRDWLITWWVNSFTEPTGIFAARISPNGLLLDGLPTNLGIPLGKAEDFADRFAYPNLVSNGHSLLVTWLENIELSGTSKKLLAKILVPQPRIIAVALAQSVAAEATISFESQSGQNYHLEASQDLVAWQPVGAPLVGTGGLLQATVTGQVSRTGFFRVASASLDSFSGVTGWDSGGMLAG